MVSTKTAQDGEWVMVPLEPTEEMTYACRYVLSGDRSGNIAAPIYRAMLSAAPPAPAAEPVAWQARFHGVDGWGPWQECREKDVKVFAESPKYEVRALGVIAPPPVEASQQQASGGAVEPRFGRFIACADGETPDATADSDDEASQQQASGEPAELAAWLRENSGGIYRKCATAADVLETLAQELSDAKAEAEERAAENAALRKLLKQADDLYTSYGLVAGDANCGPWINAVRAALAAQQRSENRNQRDGER